ncbi:uncharacterized protein LOC114799657 [Denticeps clupeoides]|uniref:uncharacterized protein LOC114799657 n=1 Tax=Denticeps clupeoides TaxID=299321 RepID=UPI0010A4C00F|nr:uncharacterized protein LOC114799657 [Denticeps clupeoides]
MAYGVSRQGVTVSPGTGTSWRHCARSPAEQRRSTSAPPAVEDVQYPPHHTPTTISSNVPRPLWDIPMVPGPFSGATATIRQLVDTIPKPRVDNTGVDKPSGRKATRKRKHLAPVVDLCVEKAQKHMVKKPQGKKTKTAFKLPEKPEGRIPVNVDLDFVTDWTNADYKAWDAVDFARSDIATQTEPNHIDPQRYRRFSNHSECCVCLKQVLDNIVKVYDLQEKLISTVGIIAKAVEHTSDLKRVDWSSLSTVLLRLSGISRV